VTRYFEAAASARRVLDAFARAGDPFRRQPERRPHAADHGRGDAGVRTGGPAATTPGHRAAITAAIGAA
jgi:hypothetical protein